MISYTSCQSTLSKHSRCHPLSIGSPAAPGSFTLYFSTTHSRTGTAYVLMRSVLYWGKWSVLLRKVSFCVLDISWLQAGGDSPASAFQELSHHEQQKEILVKMPQRQSVCSFCVRHCIHPQLWRTNKQTTTHLIFPSPDLPYSNTKCPWDNKFDLSLTWSALTHTKLPVRL